MLRLELSKIIRSKSFFLSLLVGIVLFVMQAINVKDYIETGFLDRDMYIYNLTADVSFLQAWIGQDPFSAYSLMFYLILYPMLAALPGAATHFREHKLGYDKLVISRVGRKKYVWTKCLVTFISGGMAVTIPSVLSLMWSMSWLPIIPMDLSMMQTGIMASSMWAAIFVEEPLLYAVLYILLDFVVGGLLACCAISLTYIVRSIFELIIIPMLCNLLFVELLNYAPGSLQRLCRLVPYCYVSPYALVDVQYGEVLISMLIMVCVVFGLYLYLGERRDVL